MAYALDFTAAARTDAPAIAVTQGTFGSACSNISTATSGASGIAQLDKSQVVPTTAMSAPGGRFAELRTKADALGFPAPQ